MTRFGCKSSDGQYWNQIDYIFCSQRWRNSIQSAKTRPGSNCGSDHQLLIAKFRLKLKKVGKPTRSFAAAAAAKLLQSRLTLWDSIDGSLTGSLVPGILQARTLEWVAISFSNAWNWKVKGKSLSRVWLLATSWTAAYQAPLSVGFSRQEYWSGVSLPSPTPLFFSFKVMIASSILLGLPRCLSDKESTCQCRRHGFSP